MRVWKVLVFLAMPYIILGCCKCADYIVVSSFSFCSLNTSVIDTSLSQRIKISSADTIAADNFGIAISFETSEGLCKTPISIFKEAAACKCENPNRFLLKESVESFIVTTNNDFDASHNAGDTINSYFSKVSSNAYQPLDEFIMQELSIEDEPLEILYTSFDLKLLQKPTVAGKHSFCIEILFSDNRLLRATTREVYLN